MPPKVSAGVAQPVHDPALRRILLLYFDPALPTLAAAPHYACPWPRVSASAAARNHTAHPLLPSSWGGMSDDAFADSGSPPSMNIQPTNASFNSPLLPQQQHQDGSGRPRADSFNSEYSNGDSTTAAGDHASAPVFMPWLAAELCGTFPSPTAIAAAEHMQEYLDDNAALVDDLTVSGGAMADAVPYGTDGAAGSGAQPTDVCSPFRGC
jgi:hypothetical protein